ncbi:HesA/MoeB/ThiF family protein [Salidesulfovibrio onnuriiensis]|uniref:HesA/MoeB/ThiF family protein n=1 Tax=Salidesulfovibrio onnuriiensis TaxID=2583823 RepID=UPI0011CAF3F8|nr:ThiF family adenylyltransferase [Salidesulfovibrio onnuriiensis]
MIAPSLPQLIRQHAVNIPLPGGEHGDTIGIEAVADIAEKLSMPGWQVEAESLSMGVIPLRYLRNMDSITASMQRKLLQSRIAQVGMGGLGGTLLETFARTGIGRIRAADGDAFEESNLNRQALATMHTLGAPKAWAGTERCLELNPSIELDAQESFLAQESLPTFIQGCSVAVDALGGLQTRTALQDAASAAGVPLVTGALAGWTGYVSVVLPGSLGPAQIMGNDNSAEEELGCPAAAVNFFASLMAGEVIKLLTHGQSPLAGHMLVVDLDALSFDRISL